MAARKMMPGTPRTTRAPPASKYLRPAIEFSRSIYKGNTAGEPEMLVVSPALRVDAGHSLAEAAASRLSAQGGEYCTGTTWR
jgi:hypothetical protein